MCRHCGWENPDEAAFCTNCGRGLARGRGAEVSDKPSQRFRALGSPVVTVRASDGPPAADPPLPRLNPPPSVTSAPTLLDFRMPEQMLAELARAREAKARPSSAPPPAEAPEPTRTPPRPEPSTRGMAVVRPSRQQVEMGAIARALREEAGSPPPSSRPPEAVDEPLLDAPTTGKLPPLPIIDELDEELGSVDIEPDFGSVDGDVEAQRPTMRLHPPEAPLSAIETMEPEEIPPEDDDAEWFAALERSVREGQPGSTDADRPALPTERGAPPTMPETPALAALTDTQVLPARPAVTAADVPAVRVDEDWDDDAGPSRATLDEAIDDPDDALGLDDAGPLDDAADDPQPAVAPIDDAGPGEDDTGAEEPGTGEVDEDDGDQDDGDQDEDDGDDEDDEDDEDDGDQDDEGVVASEDDAGADDDDVPPGDEDEIVVLTDLRAAPATLESIPPLDALPAVLVDLDATAPAVADDDDDDDLPFARASDDSAGRSLRPDAEDEAGEPDAFSGVIDGDVEIPSIPPGGDADDLLEDVEDLIEEVDEDASDLLASDEFEAFNIARAVPPPLPPAGFILRPLTENLDPGLLVAVGTEGLSIGRGEADLVVDDAWASPVHAALVIEDDALYVDDLDSENGVWLRVRDEVVLHPGDHFLAGEHLFRVELAPTTPAPGASATKRLGAGGNLSGLLLVVEAADGTVTHQIRVPAEGCRIGRHLADLVFTDDGFMSGTHALLRPRADTALLRDLESRNGTWRRVQGRARLDVGDALMIGRTALRVGAPAR
ncbi:MAG: FHA domain-containing protein [Myxococcales bacterium]|nr:FHA domain-containing protein [Myxococcales bacterium]